MRRQTQGDGDFLNQGQPDSNICSTIVKCEKCEEGRLGQREAVCSRGATKWAVQWL
jgi:hypothetical protein